MADVGGRTTKRTYVTKYTTDVDPRTLPDFASRGVVTGNGDRHDKGHHAPAPLPMPPQHHHQQHRHSPSYSVSPASSVVDSEDGHRLRRKYTTTTVTTITTTTVLLPKTQEALVFPSTTTRQMQQQSHARPAIEDDYGYGDDAQGQVVQTQLSRQPRRVQQLDSERTSPASASPDRQRQLQSSNSANGRRLVPAQPQYGPDGTGTQAWVFNQHTANEVQTEESRHRLPTLEELGITSYFTKDGQQQQQQQQQERRAAPYAPANLRSNGRPHQPWITAETRHEVEGGKRYY